MRFSFCFGLFFTNFIIPVGEFLTWVRLHSTRRHGVALTFLCMSGICLRVPNPEMIFAQTSGIFKVCVMFLFFYPCEHSLVD